MGWFDGVSVVGGDSHRHSRRHSSGSKKHHGSSHSVFGGGDSKKHHSSSKSIFSVGEPKKHSSSHSIFSLGEHHNSSRSTFFGMFRAAISKRRFIKLSNILALTYHLQVAPPHLTTSVLHARATSTGSSRSCAGSCAT
jgi:hypothetical protein